jgi:hypothetical protein
MRYPEYRNVSSAQSSHDDVIILGGKLKSLEKVQPESAEDNNTLRESCLNLCRSFTEAAQAGENNNPNSRKCSTRLLLRNNRSKCVLGYIVNAIRSDAAGIACAPPVGKAAMTGIRERRIMYSIV